MSVENCDNCAFGVKRYAFGAASIECHKKAPVAIVEKVGDRETSFRIGDIVMMEPIMGPVARWPSVQSTDFCGEWELQDAK